MSFNDTEWGSSSDTSTSDSFSDTSFDTSSSDFSSDTSFDDLSMDDSFSDSSFDDTSFDTASDESFDDLSVDDSLSDSSFDDASFDTAADESLDDLSVDDSVSDSAFDDASFDMTADESLEDLSVDDSLSDSPSDDASFDATMDESFDGMNEDDTLSDSSADDSAFDADADGSINDATMGDSLSDASIDDVALEMAADESLNELTADDSLPDSATNEISMNDASVEEVGEDNIEFLDTESSDDIDSSDAGDMLSESNEISEENDDIEYLDTADDDGSNIESLDTTAVDVSTTDDNDTSDTLYDANTTDDIESLDAESIDNVDVSEIPEDNGLLAETQNDDSADIDNALDSPSVDQMTMDMDDTESSAEQDELDIPYTTHDQEDTLTDSDYPSEEDYSVDTAEDDPPKILKRDEFELLQAGNNAINQRLEVQEDEYRDQGLSDDEIADRLAADKWKFQKEFLEDAFPGQDVSPHVFNGFNENGTMDRIAEMERSPLLREEMSQASKLDQYDVGNTTDIGAYFDDDPPKVLKRDEFELLQAGNNAINQRLEVQEDEYRDQGLSDDEIADRLAADKWKFQKEFLEDAFPGQDVSPHVFNGFNENGTMDRIAEMERSPLLREEMSQMSKPDQYDVGDNATDIGAYFDDINAAELAADAADSDQLGLNDMLAPEDHADNNSDTAPDAADRVAAVDSVDEWLGDINPNFDPFDPNSPYCNNCGSCAWSVYQRLEGMNSDACASAQNIGYNSEMEALTGMKQVSMSPGDIEKALLAQGDGAHAIIGVDRSNGYGHWFNAACINGRVVAIDGQSGEITDWPPDYGDVVNWEMSVKA